MPTAADTSSPETRAEAQASPADSAAPKQADEKKSGEPKSKKKKHHFLRWIGFFFLFLLVLLVAARLALPTALRWYVNRTIDKNPMYDGKIGGIDVSLWRGAYTIHDIRLVKTTGNVPVPFYAAKQVDLAIQWDALWNRKIVGKITMDSPELNFVDSNEESKTQTGNGGPWLEMIRDLFPFKINSCNIKNGSIHFHAFDTNPPVDIYLSELQASITNLGNIHNDITPLIATVKADGMAMGQAKFDYEMKLDPFSYRPTFQLAVRLIGLDVTKVNALAQAYGTFDFERGWFDLVVELDAKEGQLKGYVKPLFRNIQVLDIKKDIKKDNVVEFFWEALVGVATGILKNPPRDQFGTVIPLSGDMTGPKTDILAVVGHVLRNAFVRAYLPKLEGTADRVENLDFGKGSITELPAVGDEH